MSLPHRSSDPQRPPDRPVPPLGTLSQELGKDLREGLAEIAVWTVAVLIVVGVPALVGYAVAGGGGLLGGAGLGVVVLAVTWAVLIVKGMSLAHAVLRRPRNGH